MTGAGGSVLEEPWSRGGALYTKRGKSRRTDVAAEKDTIINT